MKYRPILTAGASGKLGGIVFAHNKGGNYVRQFRVPTNPNTGFQQDVRDFVSFLSNRWVNVLTEAQRVAWGVFAANMTSIDTIGESITLTGLNWYIKCNTLRMQAGLATVTDGPTTFSLSSITAPVPTIVAAGTTVSVAFTDTDAWANVVGGALLVYASRPQNQSINFFKGPFRFAGAVLGAASPPTSPAVINLPFAIGPADSKMFFRFIGTLEDGRPSSTFRVVASA